MCCEIFENHEHQEIGDILATPGWLYLMDLQWNLSCCAFAYRFRCRKILRGWWMLVKWSENSHITAVFAAWEAPGLPNLEEMGRVRSWKSVDIWWHLVAVRRIQLSGNVEHGGAAAEPKRCVQRRLGLLDLIRVQFSLGIPWILRAGVCGESSLWQHSLQFLVEWQGSERPSTFLRWLKSVEQALWFKEFPVNQSSEFCECSLNGSPLGTRIFFVSFVTCRLQIWYTQIFWTFKAGQQKNTASFYGSKHRWIPMDPSNTPITGSSPISEKGPSLIIFSQR